MRNVSKIIGLAALLVGIVLADSKSEADLRVKVASEEAARIVAAKNNAVLTAQVNALIKSNADLAARLKDIAKAAISANADKLDGAAAVVQAQAESTQTLVNTNQSVEAQTEFEKQLTRVETNLNSVLASVKHAVELLIVLTALVLCFTGAIVYSSRVKGVVVEVKPGKTEVIPHAKEG